MLMEFFVPPHLKLCLVLAVVCVAPSFAGLALLESGRSVAAMTLLSLHTALGLAFLPFLSKLILYLVVHRDLATISAFACHMRKGVFPEPFTLPVEKEDEHTFTRLRRNLNWMLHVLRDRENRLLWQLEETDQDRRTMEDLSRTDPLTGLGNRRAFEQMLLSLSGDMRPKCWCGQMLFMDCDKFKDVNDAHGHQAGDSVLRGLARVIRESVREGKDHPFRLGGDEFAVLLTCRNPEAAMEIAERIRARFKVVNDHGCTLSLGLVAVPCRTCEPPAENWNSTIALADTAVYDAKRRGGDAVCVR